MELTAIEAGIGWLKGTGWKWIVAGLTALSILYLGWSLHSARTALSNTRATLAAREGEILLLRTARQADDTAIQTRTIYVDRVTKEATDRKAKTDEALKANPDWASVLVPPAVADSLR